MEQHLVSLLVKIAVAAALASILVRVNALKRMLLREERTLIQRVHMAIGFSTIFGAGVATRIVTGVYKAVDLGLEGSLLAGLLGGYVTGLVSGVLISLPAVFRGEWLTMPLFAGVGVLGGLLRDLAPNPEEIWKFSPFLDRAIRRGQPARTRLFHAVFAAAILFSEFLRWTAQQLFPKALFALYTVGEHHTGLVIANLATTLFAVTLPLKIWNNARNEEKLESQQRLLNEARLAALMRQIN